MRVSRALGLVLSGLLAGCAAPTPPIDRSPSSSEQPARPLSNQTASPTPRGSSPSPTVSASASPSTAAVAAIASSEALLALGRELEGDVMAATTRDGTVSSDCMSNPPCLADNLKTDRKFWVALAIALRHYVQGRDAITFPARFAARADAEKAAVRTYWRLARRAAAATSQDQFKARVTAAQAAGVIWGDALQLLKDELGEALGFSLGP